MFAKLLLKDGEQWNRPDARLRLRSLPVTVLIELPTDAYLAFVEVDVFPAQRKRRRYAKPRSREGRNDRSVARSCTGAQATDLLVTQPAWLPSSDLPGLLMTRADWKSTLHLPERLGSAASRPSHRPRCYTSARSSRSSERRGLYRQRYATHARSHRLGDTEQLMRHL